MHICYALGQTTTLVNDLFYLHHHSTLILENEDPRGSSKVSLLLRTGALALRCLALVGFYIVGFTRTNFRSMFRWVVVTELTFRFVESVLQRSPLDLLGTFYPLTFRVHLFFGGLIPLCLHNLYSINRQTKIYLFTRSTRALYHTYTNLRGPAIVAAREHLLTLPLEEAKTTIQTILEESLQELAKNELHIPEKLAKDSIFSEYTCAISLYTATDPVLDPTNSHTIYQRSFICRALTHQAISPITRSRLYRSHLIELPHLKTLIKHRLDWYTNLNWETLSSDELERLFTTPADSALVSAAKKELSSYQSCPAPSYSGVTTFLRFIYNSG